MGHLCLASERSVVDEYGSAEREKLGEGDDCGIGHSNAAVREARADTLRRVGAVYPDLTWTAAETLQHVGVGREAKRIRAVLTNRVRLLEKIDDEIRSRG